MKVRIDMRTLLGPFAGLIFFLGAGVVMADSGAQTTGEFGLGLAIPDFTGVAATRRAASAKRDIAYPTGMSMGLAAHRRLPWESFYLGAFIRLTNGGAINEKGEAHFFNPGFAGLSIRYLVWAGWELGLEVGPAWATNKLKYKNSSKGPVFHEFGVGFGGAVSMGYRFPLGDGYAVVLRARYGRHRIRVELASAQEREYWNYGITGLEAAFLF